MFPFVSVAEIFTVARETRALHYIQKSERFRTVSVQNRQKTVEKPLFFELSDMREKKSDLNYSALISKKFAT